MSEHLVVDSHEGGERSPWTMLREAASERRPFRLFGVEYEPVRHDLNRQRMIEMLSRDVIRAELCLAVVERDLAVRWPDTPSEQVQTRDGRYVLADALAQLAISRAALLAAMSR